jgi:AhpD family alkylhydroperoxidase
MVHSAVRPDALYGGARGISLSKIRAGTDVVFSTDSAGFILTLAVRQAYHGFSASRLPGHFPGPSQADQERRRNGCGFGVRFQPFTPHPWPAFEEEPVMTRNEVYRDIEGVFGLVPSFFKLIPDKTLDLEWELFKRIQLEDGAIPNKYRELIGLGIAAATKCRYCALYHTEIAKLYGATDAEIEEAVHYAKASAGWSAYINGLQIDYNRFKAELLQACEHVRRKQSEQVKLSA